MDKLPPTAMSRRKFFDELSELSALVKTTLKTDSRLDFESAIYADSIRQDLLAYASLLPTGDLSILDIGCGKGYISYLLKHIASSVTAVDIKSSVGEQLGIVERGWQLPLWQKFEERAQDRLSYSFYDGRKTTFDDNSFDSVCAYAVIEHVEPTLVNEWITEISRVLKPGGILFIAKCPRHFSFNELLAKSLGMAHHERRFKYDEIRDLLIGHDFEILQMRNTNLFPAFPPSSRLQGAYNALAPMLLACEKAMSLAHLDWTAHHYRLVLRNMK